MADRTGPGSSPDWEVLGEAARRGLQRAGIHLMKAAIELVAAVGAFIDEIRDREGGEEPPGSGPTRIDVE